MSTTVWTASCTPRTAAEFGKLLPLRHLRYSVANRACCDWNLSTFEAACGDRFQWNRLASFRDFRTKRPWTSLHTVPIICHATPSASSLIFPKKHLCQESLIFFPLCEAAAGGGGGGGGGHSEWFGCRESRGLWTSMSNSCTQLNRHWL